MYKFFQTSRKYIQIFLGVLIICLSIAIVQAQSLQRTAASNLLTPVFSNQNYIDATFLVQQGEKFYAAEQFSKAIKSWQLAAKAFQSQGNTLNYAQALNLLSLAYQQLGLYLEANQTIADSLKILQTLKFTKKTSVEQLKLIAQALNNQGQLQLKLGQTEKALSSWQQSAATYSKVGDRIGVIGSLLNQAQALQVLGHYRQSINTLNSINKELLLTRDSLLKVSSLISLGDALRMVGNLEYSRQILQQSLTLAQQLKSSSNISAALFSLGNTARAQQDTKAALAFYQQAATASSSDITWLQPQLNQLSLLLDTKQLSAAQALQSKIKPRITALPPSRATVYAQINFAKSLTQLRQASDETSLPLDVARILAEAVSQAQSLEDRRAEAYALGHLGRLYEQNQQWSSAQNLTEKALFLAHSINAPDITYRFSWQLGRLLKARGETQGAIASYTEAVNALNLLRTDLITINPDIQFSFRDEVEPVYRELVELLLRSPNNSQPTQQNLVQARNIIESLQLSELDNFLRSACLEGKLVQVDQVIDQQDPTAAVIYPIILADRLEVILKLPGQPLRHYKTNITQNEVEKRIRQLRQQLTKEYMFLEARALSKQVYDWLIQPAENDLAKSKVKTLVFVLDGTLRNIPMSALYDGQHYLVEKYATVLTPGLQLLPPQPIKEVKLNALTAGLTKPRRGFSALPNVALELNQIKSQVNSTTLLNEKFTSATLEKELNEIFFSIVHIATHGQFSSQAAKTFVLAWDKPINFDELNNLLQLRSTTVRNPLELLVLSACETAAGDNWAALGLAGVAVRSGARSTLASLWSIDDEGSAVLMGEFYRELTQGRLNRAEALRQAQLALLREPNYRHPRYWAAYVLVGNWL